MTVPVKDASVTGDTQGRKTPMDPQASHFIVGQQPKPTYANMAQFNIGKILIIVLLLILMDLLL